MIRALFFGFTLAGSSLSVMAADNAIVSQAQPVSICIGDGNEWAPYTYWARVDGVPDRRQLIGAATENVLGALRAAGLDYRINYMPWKRVLYEIEHFNQNHLCELTWDASFKPERALVFYYSDPLYSTHLGVFYSTHAFPDGPRLNSPEDINRFQLCGVSGYNYGNFPIARPEAMDLSSTDLSRNLQKLTLKRCELMPSEIEPVYGGAVLGSLTLTPDIRSERLPDHRKTFHAVISKQSERGVALTATLNQQLQKMRADGTAEALYRQHLPDGSGL